MIGYTLGGMRAVECFLAEQPTYKEDKIPKYLLSYVISIMENQIGFSCAL